jgi:hypothetical protein
MSSNRTPLDNNDKERVLDVLENLAEEHGAALKAVERRFAPVEVGAQDIDELLYDFVQELREKYGL